MNLQSKILNKIKQIYKNGINFGLKTIKRILPKPVTKQLKQLYKLWYKDLIAKNQVTLFQLLGEYKLSTASKAIIIFPPSLDWNVQLFQRPQQLALALAEEGALVFYIQPKPDRKEPPFKLITDRLYLCNVHVDTFRLLTNPIIYLLTWNSDYASSFSDPQIIYDFVDDINVFYGDHDEIIKGHQFLLENSAIVLATAAKLVEEALKHRKDIIYSPNGVVYEHFARTVQHKFSNPPEDMKDIFSMSKPVIGYYGALAKWFDYNLLNNVAAMRPQYEFVLIGPDYDGTLVPANISNNSNVHWLGVKKYDELPEYLQYFDVATIPFIVNEITHATSPLKLFEYMASEKPIVITPMRESMHYPGVLVGENAEEFSHQLDKALELRNDQVYLDLLRTTAQENTWKKRAEIILATISRNLKFND